MSVDHASMPVGLSVAFAEAGCPYPTVGVFPEWAIAVNAGPEATFGGVAMPMVTAQEAGECGIGAISEAARRGRIGGHRSNSLRCYGGSGALTPCRFYCNTVGGS